MATDTTFKDMLNENVDLMSVHDILANDSLTKTKKIIMLTEAGINMKSAQKMVEEFSPTEDESVGEEYFKPRQQMQVQAPQPLPVGKKKVAKKAKK